MAQLALGITDIGCEKGVLLQSSGEKLELTCSALIQNNEIVFDISQKTDSIVIYGTNGDTNGDNDVTIKDLMQVLYHVSDRTAMNEAQKGFAEVDMNNAVNIQDLMRELYYVSGRNSTLWEAK